MCEMKDNIRLRGFPDEELGVVEGAVDNPYFRVSGFDRFSFLRVSC